MESYHWTEKWVRGKDSNLRPLGYEPNELPAAPPRVTRSMLRPKHPVVNQNQESIKESLKRLFCMDAGGEGMQQSL